MLSELGLRNFKAFGDKEQKAPMSKITLIYGPNSGGKSSIIQALLMLKQSLDSEQGSGRRELVPRGEYVDLGSFSDLLHKHAIDNRDLGISIKFLAHTQKTGYGVQMTFVESKPKESFMKDSSFLSEVRYQILNRNSLLLDAKLKYRSNENSWGMLRSLIANKNNPELFSKIKNNSNVFLPTLELQAEERILKLRQQYTRELGQQQQQELQWDLTSELILELIQKLGLKRKLLFILKQIREPEPGYKQELGKLLGKYLGIILGRKLRLELGPEQAQKLRQKLERVPYSWGREDILGLKLIKELELEPEEEWEWELIRELIERLLSELIYGTWTPIKEPSLFLEDLKTLLERLGPIAEFLEKLLKEIPAQIPDLILGLGWVHILMLDIEPEEICDITPADIPLSYNNLLNSITYLGPLRSYPERLYTISGRGRESTGIRGEFTPHILYYNSTIQEFEAARQLAHRNIPIGQPIVGLWSERFQMLAKISEQVTIVDRYAAWNFDNDQNDLLNLLKFLENDSPKCYVTIYSSPDAVRNSGEVDLDQIAIKLKNKVSQLGLNRIKKITLHLSPNHVFSTYAHDRYIRFDGITCVIGKGIEVFRNKKINANSTFAFKSSQFIQDSGWL